MFNNCSLVGQGYAQPSIGFMVLRKSVQQLDGTVWTWMDSDGSNWPMIEQYCAQLVLGLYCNI